MRLRRNQALFSIVSGTIFYSAISNATNINGTSSEYLESLGPGTFRLSSEFPTRDGIGSYSESGSN